MDCVNHCRVPATAYCQNCGRGLCADCTATAVLRGAVRGTMLCEGCFTAWQAYQAPFAAPRSSGPNPVAAAVFGVIPGVGAMYNGQFVKGFVHVIVFAVLVSITSAVHGNMDVFFGLMIPAWILYQAFEAYHTARALRDGEAPPDPFGLNEVGNWLNLGKRTSPYHPGQPATGQGPLNAGPLNPGPTASDPAGQASYAGQPPYQQPFTPPSSGFVDPAAPPQKPLPPMPWRSNVPVGAVVLIGLGTLFLLGQMDIFHGRLMEFAWPLVLIALGVWLIIRRIEESQGGSK